MSTDSPAQLISLLAQQQPEEILGTRESEWVDFKSIGPKGPYDLSTDKGKFELAKDAAAFANARGGLIVCGFKAKRRPTELYEVADKTTPFKKILVNSDSYKDVIAEYVRPLLRVTLHWFDDPAVDPDTGGHYFVIEVASLPETERWALVTRTINEEGNFVKGSWTIPIRNNDTTAYVSPDEAYRLVNDGLRARRGPAAAASAPPVDRLQARADLRARLDLQDTPVLFFQSTPEHPNGLLPGMYATGGLKDVLENQDTLRGPSAFNFTSLHNRPEPFEGGLLVAILPRGGLWVEQDGAVTAAVAASRDMLSWAMERYGTSSEDRRISVFILSEITLEYFRLVDAHVLPLLGNSAWQHRIVASDFARTPARLLAAGDDPSFPRRGTPQPATSDDWNQGWNALGDPERDGYEALKNLYPLFGLDVADNPFTETNRLSKEMLLPPQP